MLMLEGIRVLDFTQYLAGPTVGRLMAEMGAEMIKIEIAPNGDASRGIPIVKKPGRSGYFIQQNRGKKSLCLDLKKEGANQIVEDLIKKVDVIVENFGPGVMEKKGWDWNGVQKINPSVVMASISAYGRESTLSHKTGYDWAAQAYSGLMHMNGERDGPPLPVGIGIADIGSGVHAFSAIGYALFHKLRTGRGQWLDISMVDSMFHMHDVSLQGYSLTDGKWRPFRQGAHHELIAPFGVFRGPSGYIVIMSLQPQWENVCEAIGRPELKDHPNYLTAADRGKKQNEIIRIIETWMESFEDNNAVMEHLEKYRVPAAPVMDPVDAINEPYFHSRGMVRNIEDPVLGPLTIPGFPLKFSDQPEVLDLEAPTLGQHNREVVGDLLGYKKEAIDDLEKIGALFSKDV